MARGEAVAGVAAANPYAEAGAAQAGRDLRRRVQALTVRLLSAPPAAALTAVASSVAIAIQ